MNITPLTKNHEIKRGDLLLVQGNGNINLYKVPQVIKDDDREEVILQKKGNIYFNRSMFHDGKSWVQEVQIVTE